MAQTRTIPPKEVGQSQFKIKRYSLGRQVPATITVFLFCHFPVSETE